MWLSIGKCRIPIAFPIEVDVGKKICVNIKLCNPGPSESYLATCLSSERNTLISVTDMLGNSTNFYGFSLREIF